MARDSPDGTERARRPLTWDPTPSPSRRIFKDQLHFYPSYGRLDKQSSKVLVDSRLHVTPSPRIRKPYTRASSITVSDVRTYERTYSLEIPYATRFRGTPRTINNAVNAYNSQCTLPACLYVTHAPKTTDSSIIDFAENNRRRTRTLTHTQRSRRGINLSINRLYIDQFKRGQIM